MRLAVVAVTKGGSELARRLARSYKGAELCLQRRFILKGEKGVRALGEDIAADVARLFKGYRALVFVMAAGAVVRLIAPHIKDKLTDPAVVVMDEAGRHVVSLLSGHAGGANRLAREVAGIVGGTAVITTASDVIGTYAVDALAEALGCVVEDRGAATKVSAAIVNGEPVALYSSVELSPAVDGLGAPPGNISVYTNVDDLLWAERAASIVVSPYIVDDARLGVAAMLRPRTLVVGIGCNRGTSARKIAAFFDRSMAEAYLSPLSVRNLATIWDKRDEAGLVEFAGKRGYAVEFIGRRRLKAAATPSGRSEAVYRNMGVYGVCEPAALVSSGAKRLIVAKTKSPDVTIAVAEAPA